MLCKQTFTIIGMHCTSCALTIDLDLEDLPGVKSSQTHYAQSKTIVEYDPSRITSAQIISTLAKSGYQAVL